MVIFLLVEWPEPICKWNGKVRYLHPETFREIGKSTITRDIRERFLDLPQLPALVLPDEEYRKVGLPKKY
jgi:hypothetical protein